MTAEDAQKWAALKKASEALAEKSQRPHIPGMSVSVWGNQDPGDDSMLSRNPYAAQPPFPFLDDMQPVAPMDRVDKPTEGGLLGSAPETPGNSPRAVFPMLANDFVPEYNHPQDFPWDIEHVEEDGPYKPLNERDGGSVVAKADRVRPFGQYVTDPRVNYPNIAPADRVGNMGHYVVATEDKVPGKFGRYFEQLKGGEGARQVLKNVNQIVEATDKNKDKSINQEEYNEEVKGRQMKDDETVQKLWTRYQTREGDAMTLEDFYRMAGTGFDLGAKFDRPDVIGHQSIPQALNLGFWGQATGCKEGQYAVGAALKVMKANNEDASADNTALNALKLVCDDGEEVVSTPEGPDGEWTEAGRCPDGQVVFGVQARNKGLGSGMDNTALNSLQFLCRSRDFVKSSKLRFGEPPKDWKETSPLSPTTWVPGTVGEEGGWEPEFRCRGQQGGILCGMQPRLEVGKGELDDMGLTDMRFYCCGTEDRRPQNEATPATGTFPTKTIVPV